MSKIRLGLVALWILILVCSFAVPLAGTHIAKADSVVTFPDANLEQVIRTAIGKPTGDINQSDLAGLTGLNGPAKNIHNLSGMEYCTNMILLNFSSNQISDISPLASLTNLTALDLSSNQISDISALASLTNLTIGLGLNSNQISDISPLASLTSLTNLGLNSNQISDISPLASLTNLTGLDLNSNQISNINTLASLTNLTGLGLGNNQVSDIHPLVNNSGLSSGDAVSLNSNPLSSTSINTYIPQLQARGVSVYYDVPTPTPTPTPDTLDAPILISPANGAVAVGTLLYGNSNVRVVLLWTPIATADTYQYQVALDNTFENIVTQNSSITGAQAEVSLYANTKYYWRVMVSSGINSQWSEIWSFTTPLGPAEAPTLIAPASGSTNIILKPIFQWTGLASANNYELVVAKNCDWTNPVINLAGSSAVASTAYQITTNLDENTNYCWRVRAVGNSSISAWSAIGTFTTTSSMTTSPTLTSTPTPAATVPWLYEIHGSSASNIFAVGDTGTILHYNGKSWSHMDSSTSSTLWSAWASPEGSAFAVGNNGTILHYNGDSWTDMVSSTPRTLSGVWGSASNDVFAVGDSGLVLHYDGISWSQIRTSTGQFIHGVWGTSSNDVYAVGWDKSTQKGLLLHYDGTSWNQIDIGDYPALNRLWGSSPTDLFVVGASGTILHYNGTSWSEMTSGSTQNIHGIWGDSADNVYAVSWYVPGYIGAILHYDGNTWQNLDIADSTALAGIWGSAANDIWAVGYDSAAVHYTGAYHTDFQDSVPLASQISTNPKVIGTNALYALIMLLAFYFAATIFNSTVRDNYNTMRGWFKRKPKSPGGSSKSTGRDKTYKTRSTSFEVLVILGAVVITAALYAFLEPYFTHGLTFLIMFLSFVVAIGVVTFLYEGIQILLIKYRLEVPVTFRIRPIALVIAVAFVVVSVLVGFHPGLTLGFVGAYITLSARGRFTKQQRATPILVSASFLLAITIAAFIARTPVHDALTRGSSFGLALFDTILVSIFIIGLEGLIFALLPIVFLDGHKIAQWSKVLWGIVFGLTAFAFFHIVINKDKDITKAIQNSNLWLMVGIIVFFFLVSISLWLYFWIRKKQEKSPSHSD